METATATVREGRLKGWVDAGVSVFHGVPYGQAQRFLAPARADSWHGERDSRWPRPAAPQLPSGFAGVFGDTSPDHVSEDCLHLSVWSPATATASLPVVVWIHGGSFITGSPYLPRYDGAEFARENGVVVVLVGYRLGLLGFPNFSGDGQNASPTLNAGAWDVRQGLEWIHENISAFGGDPARVCAIGQSAGAQILAHLLTRTDVEEFVSSAILQSSPFGLQPLKSQALRSAYADVAVLRSLSVQGLLNEQAQIVRAATQAGLLDPPLRLAVDGDLVPDGALPLPPSRTPVLVTVTADEASLWFDRRATDPAHTVDAPDAPSPASSAFTGEMFRAPAIDYLKQFDPDTNSAYLLTFDLPTRGALAGMGSPHCMDIPFILGGHVSRCAPLLQGWTGPELDAVRSEVRGVWTEFAATGRPPLQPFPQRNTLSGAGLSVH